MRVDDIGTVLPFSIAKSGTFVTFSIGDKTHLGMRAEADSNGRLIPIVVSFSPGNDAGVPGTLELRALHEQPVYEIPDMSLVLPTDPAYIHPGFSWPEHEFGAIAVSGKNAAVMLISDNGRNAFLDLEDGTVVAAPPFSSTISFGFQVGASFTRETNGRYFGSIMDR